MAAKASVEIHTTGNAGQGVINGVCIAQEELSVGAAATTTLAMSAQHRTDGATHVRVSSDDTAMYAAVGPVPDATLTAKGVNSSARVMVPAGASVELPMVQGDKVSVKAV
jgi:hypothetical protein